MASPASAPTRIRFDAFELDVTSGELRKAGILLKLQPQPFRVLLLLIERAGQVVTREEIQRCLWTDSTFVDFEHGINFSIHQIRSALADSAENPRYVETIPRRGYRFIAEVHQPPEGSTNIVEVPNVHKFRFIASAVLVLILTAAVSYGVYSFFGGKRGAPYGSPAFSPDGNYIYFLKALNRAQTGFNLLRSPVLGGTPQVVVRNLDSGITFAPDGRRMAYVRRNDPEVGKFQLLMANTDGTEEKMLGGRLQSDAIVMFEFSPDGENLAVMRSHSESDVVLLHNTTTLSR